MAPITFKLSYFKLSINANAVSSNNYLMPVLTNGGALFTSYASAALLNQLFLIDKASYTANPNDVAKWHLGLRLFTLDAASKTAANTAGITESTTNLIRPISKISGFTYDNSKVIISAPNVTPIINAPALLASTSTEVGAWATTGPNDVYLVSDAPYTGYAKTVGTDYLTYYAYKTLGATATVNLPNIVIGVPQYIATLEGLLQTELDSILAEYANELQTWDQTTASTSAATNNYLFELVKQMEKNDYARITTSANYVEAVSEPATYTLAGASVVNASVSQTLVAADSYGFLFQVGDILQFQVSITTTSAPITIDDRISVFQVILT